MPYPLSTAALLFGFAFAILSAYLAHRRGRNPYIWFCVGFFFGIFGVMAIFFAPQKKPKEAVQPIPEPIPAPILSIQGPTDKFWYYLDPTHQQQGPMSLDALTLAWREGRISPATFVWHEDLSDWKPLKDLLKS